MEIFLYPARGFHALIDYQKVFSSLISFGKRQILARDSTLCSVLCYLLNSQDYVFLCVLVPFVWFFIIFAPT